LNNKQFQTFICLQFSIVEVQFSKVGIQDKISGTITALGLSPKVKDAKQVPIEVQDKVTLNKFHSKTRGSPFIDLLSVFSRLLSFVLSTFLFS
jgi:hypothetical protein